MARVSRKARSVNTAKTTTATCCTPTRGERPGVSTQNCIRGTRRVSKDAAVIHGGHSLIGSATAKIPNDGEAPLRKSKVKPFLMDTATVTAYKEPADIHQFCGCISTASIIIGTDVFDAGSMPRLREARDELSHGTGTCVIAVTSFMPGAFREYAQRQGANLCVTEEQLLEPVAIITDLASLGEG